MLEDAAANEARRAGENEMHFCVSWTIGGLIEGKLEEGWEEMDRAAIFFLYILVIGKCR